MKSAVRCVWILNEIRTASFVILSIVRVRVLRTEWILYREYYVYVYGQLFPIIPRRISHGPRALSVEYRENVWPRGIENTLRRRSSAVPNFPCSASCNRQQCFDFPICCECVYWTPCNNRFPTFEYLSSLKSLFFRTVILQSPRQLPVVTKPRVPMLWQHFPAW